MKAKEHINFWIDVDEAPELMQTLKKSPNKSAFCREIFKLGWETYNKETFNQDDIRNIIREEIQKVLKEENKGKEKELKEEENEILNKITNANFEF
ncbi:MAG: hypothetical protein ACOCUI_04350 [bacterium]